jgi:carboxyl-terminal processing protease
MRYSKSAMRSNRFITLFAGILITLFIALPFVQKHFFSAQNSYSIIENKMRTMNQILYHVNELYFEDINMEKLMDGAFSGIMKELDPHSIYIPAKKQKDVDELFRGKFQGIGIEFDILNGYITVISPVADSPSERAGLLPGDQITAIDGEDAYNITKEDVYQTLRGARGTSVDLMIRRIGGEEFPVTIIRDDIPIYSVRAATMFDEKTGYIWLTRFSASTSKEMKASLEKLEELGMTQLILDLRMNSGGYLEQAAETANMFIARPDTLVFTKGKQKKLEQVFIANPKKGREDFPLIILINRGSASASEIVAGAVQDLDRGLIAGETSFGKGLVQRQVPMNDGSAIRVTIARYFTPSGRLIQRPYEDGKDHNYYKELYADNREAKIDSLKELRPKYQTRSGRIVYGGGGITPDKYIPQTFTPKTGTQKVLANSKRPLFNWGSNYANEYWNELVDFNSFKNSTFSDNELESFFNYLSEEEIVADTADLNSDRDYLVTMLRAEIASARWGKDEAFGIRIHADNQIMTAFSYFNEATAFLQSSQ